MILLVHARWYYVDAIAVKGGPTTARAPGMGSSLCDPGRRETAKTVRSYLSPTEEYFAPAYASGWVPRALPRIYLVGTMRAVAPGGAAFLPRGRKTRGLLACLCAAHGERLSRSRLVG